MSFDQAHAKFEAVPAQAFMAPAAEAPPPPPILLLGGLLSDGTNVVVSHALQEIATWRTALPLVVRLVHPRMHAVQWQRILQSVEPTTFTEVPKAGSEEGAETGADEAAEGANAPPATGSELVNAELSAAMQQKLQAALKQRDAAVPAELQPAVELAFSRVELDRLAVRELSKDHWIRIGRAPEHKYFQPKPPPPKPKPKAPSEGAGSRGKKKNAFAAGASAGADKEKEKEKAEKEKEKEEEKKRNKPLQLQSIWEQRDDYTELIDVVLEEAIAQHKAQQAATEAKKRDSLSSKSAAAKGGDGRMERRKSSKGRTSFSDRPGSPEQMRPPRAAAL